MHLWGHLVHALLTTLLGNLQCCHDSMVTECAQEAAEPSGSDQEPQQIALAPGLCQHLHQKGCALTPGQREKLFRQFCFLLERWPAITAGKPIYATGSLEVGAA